MRNLLLACVLVAATATTAAAKDDFDQFVADLVAKPDAATARLKDCQTLVSPAGQVRTPCSLTLADLAGTQTGVTLAVKQNKHTHFPKSQMEYRDALVEVRAGKKTVATYRVLEVLGMGGPSGVSGVVAAHWVRLIADKDAAAAAKAGTLVAPPAIKDTVLPEPKPGAAYDQDANDKFQAFDTLRDRITNDNDFKAQIAGWVEYGAIAWGSGPKQRYAGKSAAKTIEKWKLTLTPSRSVTIEGTGWVLWGVNTVVAQPTAAGAKPITYVLFVVFTSGLTPGGGSFTTDPALLSFAVPQ
jgi:hypothetical protein